MKNQTLNNAFPIVAAALGNKFGVKVSVGGQNAYTDGNSINLPAYNLDDAFYKDIAWGYLAHEAAHCRFSDFVEFRNASTSPIRASMVNIIEDIRIEKEMINLYPGTKFTIQKMDEYICSSSQFVLVDKSSHPAEILTQFLLLRLSSDVLGFYGLSPLADKVEFVLEDTFPVGAVTRLAGLLSQVSSLASTRDSIRLSDDILRMIQEEQEKEQEKARQQQSQQVDTDDSSSQSSASTDSQDDPSDEVTSDSSDDSQSVNDDSDTDENGKNQTQTQTSQQSDDDDQDQQSGQGLSSSSGSDSDQQDDSNDSDIDQFAQALSAVLSAGDDDVCDDLIEVVKDLLGSQSRPSYDHDVHLPLPMDPFKNQTIGSSLVNSVLNESGKIRASLQGLVQSSRYDRPVCKRSGNRIDGRKLSRLVQGDSRVFERRNHHQSPNTAIHLLVDASGSMNAIYDLSRPTHRRINLAIESAIALALALEGITGVNPAITKFPYGDTENVVSLLKHGQKVRPNAAVFSADVSGSTPLDSALWYAASSVLATREERKIIMVLTDGEPDNLMSTRSIIHRCQASGIETIGVGIAFDTSHLFDNSILISNVSELRSELFRISKDLLLAA